MQALTPRPESINRNVLIAVVLGVVLVVISAAPAAAHTSSYCGHGTDGILNITQFVKHHYWQPTYHQYNHHLNTGEALIWLHDEYRYCAEPH